MYKTQPPTNGPDCLHGKSFPGETLPGKPFLIGTPLANFT